MYRSEQHVGKTGGGESTVGRNPERAQCLPGTEAVVLPEVG